MIGNVQIEQNVEQSRTISEGKTKMSDRDDKTGFGSFSIVLATIMEL